MKDKVFTCVHLKYRYNKWDTEQWILTILKLMKIDAMKTNIIW